MLSDFGFVALCVFAVAFLSTGLVLIVKSTL